MRKIKKDSTWWGSKQGLTKALDVGVAVGAGRAAAHGLVAAADAGGGHGAGLAVADGAANAVQAVAGLVVGAVLVVLAHAGHARQEWVALRAGRADALRAVGLHQALGAAAAAHSAVHAGVQAVALDARLVVHAVRVSLALRCGQEDESQASVERRLKSG